MAETRWLERVLIASPNLALCGSETEYHDALYSLDLEPSDGGKWLGAGGTTHTFDTKGTTFCIVCIDFEDAKNRPLDQIVGILTHEAVHVWQKVVEDMNEHKPSCEFEAYGIQCITQRLVAEFIRRTQPENEDGSSSRSVQDSTGCDPEQPEHH